MVASTAQPLGDKLDIDSSAPTKNEILNAIKSLKSNKAPGMDAITAEVLKLLHSHYQSIYAR